MYICFIYRSNVTTSNFHVNVAPRNLKLTLNLKSIGKFMPEQLILKRKYIFCVVHLTVLVTFEQKLGFNTIEQNRINFLRCHFIRKSTSTFHFMQHLLHSDIDILNT